MNKIMFHLNCLERGGAERVVSNLANHLVKEGYEVIVATEWQGEEEYSLDERVKRIHVGLKEEDKKDARLIKAWKRLLYLRKLILKEKPDVTLAFAHNAIYRALGASLFTKAKIIIAVRINPIGNYDGLIDKLLIPVLYPRAAGAVFQTEEQRDFFPKYIRDNSAVIYNPLNDKYILADRPENREKTVVHSGRLVDFKNQKMLIQAFVKVHPKYPEYELKLYGGDSFDGTLQILEETIRDNKAEEYVKLMGSSDELEKELVKGAVYVLSSDYEGMPNALLEAMALGLPVVATDCPCGGPRAVIQDGVNGLLIPVGDMDAMAEAIEHLLEDRIFAEKLGTEARKISEKLNVSVIADEWKKYIERIIN